VEQRPTVKASLIATPLIDGRAEREFITSLISCQGLYRGWACVEGVSHIGLARHLLAAQFLASGCDRMVFIDGDIAFTRADLERLLAADKSVVSGMYPRKSPAMNWSFKSASTGTEDRLPAKALAPARYVPCGFPRVDRRVFNDIANSGSCTAYS
jgi:hypothetical protein